MPVDTKACRVVIDRQYPFLRGRPETLHESWDSTAFDIADSWIFKFPRSDAAAARLRREASLLHLLRGRVTLPIPVMTVHDDAILFSAHPKLNGDQLPPESYATLTDPAKNRLAADLSRFFAELHTIPVTEALAAGAIALPPLALSDPATATALAFLPGPVQSRAEQALADFAALPADPFGDIYGFFDAHGWNMAFGAERGMLAGIYDFADSGIGPLHREFVAPSFISPDLTRRTATAYAALTGRQPDRRRIWLLTAAVRLSELAQAADSASDLPAMRTNAIEWLDLQSLDEAG